MLNAPWTVTRCANGEFEVTDNGGKIVLYMKDETKGDPQFQKFWAEDCKRWLEVVEVINAIHAKPTSEQVNCAALAYGPKSFSPRIKDALECYQASILQAQA